MATPRRKQADHSPTKPQKKVSLTLSLSPLGSARLAYLVALAADRTEASVSQEELVVALIERLWEEEVSPSVKADKT